MNRTVAILRCSDYLEDEVYRTVEKAVDLLGGIDRFAAGGERILLKPNLLTAKPPEAAATTHPAVVKALIRLVKKAGATPVVGDSPGMGSVFRNADKAGILEACRELDCEFVDLKTTVSVENPGGKIFKRLEVAKEALDVDGIINLPKLKTHAQMLLTLGVKNVFGCVPGKLKPQWHLSAGINHSSFAGMLLDLYLFLRPRLTVMDGIVGMEGNGPGSGDPVRLGLILAAKNSIAMDRVIAEIVGARWHDVPLLREAARQGRGPVDLSDIKVSGEDIEDVRAQRFKLPPLATTNFAERFPDFIEKRLRKALTTRPHIDTQTCTLCGMCVDICPAGVMEKGKKINIDYSGCIRCYCCQEVCPDSAISMKEGWLKRILPGL